MLEIKTKIAIIPYLSGLGGTERSLISLLNQINPDKYQVNLFVLSEIGPLKNEIPGWVSVKKVKRYTIGAMIKNSMRRHDIKQVFQTVYCALKRRLDLIVNKDLYSYTQDHLMLQLYDLQPDIYDVAIAWALPRSLANLYTIEKVNANYKMLWIHMDVSQYENIVRMEKKYERFDRIICVSYACKKSFDQFFPAFSQKTIVFYNFIDAYGIVQGGREATEIDDVKQFRIVTCGRITGGKNPLYAIDIARSMLSDGIINFKWYFVGDGDLIDDMRRLIAQYDLENHIILLGNQLNPYKYISKVDVYVQMSKYESFCLTLAEAQILNIPCITTDFPSAHEIVSEGKTGYIVATPNDIYLKLKNMMEDKKILKNMKTNLEGKEFTAKGSIEQFEKLLDIG